MSKHKKISRNALSMLDGNIYCKTVKLQIVWDVLYNNKI